MHVFRSDSRYGRVWPESPRFNHRGELALARWRDIDFEAKTWTIPAAHSKTGIAHLLPLSPAAAKEFERLKRPVTQSFRFSTKRSLTPQAIGFEGCSQSLAQAARRELATASPLGVTLIEQGG